MHRAIETEITKERQDQVFQALWTKGRACAPDIASYLQPPTDPDEVLAVLDSLEQEGVVQKARRDPNDPREYEEPYQTCYVLAP